MTLLYFCVFFVLHCIQARTLTERLQRDAIPKSYSLKLVPNIDNDTFTGEVSILLQTRNTLKSITLNSRGLLINEITLDQAIGRTKYDIDEQFEEIHVSYSDPYHISPGEHMLNIKFEGSLDYTKGFYSTRFETNGTSRTIVATKFSAVNARSAFPCFDEPYYKSIFSIRLVKPNNNWTALSNMKEIGSFNTSQGIAVDFQSTVPMSTYLLTWILTDYTFDEIHYRSKDKIIPLRFFTSEERAGERSNLLDITKKVLEFYENYTDIPYSLPKLDSIEIPRYKSMGMEHWGMIVYQQDAVTYNANRFISPLTHFIDAQLLIAHEIAHMWFGDLVTHEWYNDLWLTEGFARFMQFKAISSIIKEPFVNSILQYNKLSNLHVIHCGEQRMFAHETVSFPMHLSSIMYNFMGTTYDQGAAILMMLEDVMGPEKFRDAIRSYLRRHQFNVATTSDFINTIQNAVPLVNIRGLMETYLFQKKFPLVLVSEENDAYVLQQKPICGTDNSIFGNKWTIPINYITSSNRTSRRVWFDRDISRLLIPKSSNDKWIKINYLNQGLYRVNYSDSIFSALQKDFLELNSEDKGSLLLDTFLLASFGNLSCSTPLQLLGLLKNMSEMDFITLNYAKRAFDLFKRREGFNPQISILLDMYSTHIWEHHRQKMGWFVKRNESFSQRLSRTSLLDLLCREVDYRLCSKEMEEIKSLNLTLHEDVANSYRDIQMKKDEELELEALKREALSSTTDSVDNVTTEFPVSDGDYDECSTWIRENIPKLLEADNQI